MITLNAYNWKEFLAEGEERKKEIEWCLEVETCKKWMTLEEAEKAADKLSYAKRPACGYREDWKKVYHY